MNDRELLEAAAKAAGIEILGWSRETPSVGFETAWNPLTDDGDALRLAVKLGLFTGPDFFHYRSLERFGHQDKDEYFATRRAIVRAAAAIGAREGAGA